MSIFRLMFAEVAFRWTNFLLCVTAVAVAATMFLAGPTLIQGYATDTDRHLAELQREAETLQTQAADMQRETEATLAKMDKQTKRIMRDLGVNLRIVHKDTNFGSLYTDFVAVDFPEEYVERLAEAESIATIVHVVATLQHKFKWHDRTVLVVGTLPRLTQSQKNEEKPHMVQGVESGTVLVGHELAAGLKEGDTMEIGEQSFKVARIMPEYGELADVQLVMHLHDAQQLLGKPGMINQIMALNCKCKGNRLSVIRKELEGVLPDTKVTEHKTRADAREKQRDLVEESRKRELAQLEANLQNAIQNRDRQEASRRRQQQMLTRLVGITTPLVVLTSALFIALMTWLNVRERRPEIGVLRALGKNAWNVASLFLGKALVLGVLGGVVGCAFGYFLTPVLGHATMDIGADLFRVNTWLLAGTLLGAPLVALLASYLPTLGAISQDPAVVLMDN